MTNRWNEDPAAERRLREKIATSPAAVLSSMMLLPPGSVVRATPDSTSRLLGVGETAIVVDHGPDEQVWVESELRPWKGKEMLGRDDLILVSTPSGLTREVVERLVMDVAGDVSC